MGMPHMDLAAYREEMDAWFQEKERAVAESRFLDQVKAQVKDASKPLIFYDFDTSLDSTTQQRLYDQHISTLESAVKNLEEMGW